MCSHRSSMFLLQCRGHTSRHHKGRRSVGSYLPLKTNKNRTRNLKIHLVILRKLWNFRLNSFFMEYVVMPGLISSPPPPPPSSSSRPSKSTHEPHSRVILLALSAVLFLFRVYMENFWATNLQALVDAALIHYSSYWEAPSLSLYFHCTITT